MTTSTAKVETPDGFSTTVTTDEISRLWQAHAIIDLAVRTIGDEPESDRPALAPALTAAMDLLINVIIERSAAEEDKF